MTRTCWDADGRPPAVCGTFYPKEPHRIESEMDQWRVAPPPLRQTWRAALIPHAGWVYSGRIAAAVLQRIVMPRTIVVFCPKHRAGGPECAIAPWQKWLFPGGGIETNVQLSQQLADEVSTLVLDDRPHRDEHAIEVQLPLLARFAPDSQLVGITIGRVDLKQCQMMAAELADVLRSRLDDVLLVVSSDMNHFADDAENRRRDELAMQAIKQLQPEQLYRTCHQHHITMCGMLPTVIVLTALQQLDALRRAVRVDYATSADAGGDTSRVVGYAGMLFD